MDQIQLDTLIFMVKLIWQEYDLFRISLLRCVK